MAFILWIFNCWLFCDPHILHISLLEGGKGGYVNIRFFYIQLLTQDYFQIIGLVCLAIGFVFLVLWTLVWIVSAEMTEKTKTIISRPSPLGVSKTVELKNIRSKKVRKHLHLHENPCMNLKPAVPKLSV